MTADVTISRSYVSSNGMSSLTIQEVRVVALVVEGLTDGHIAARLSVPPETVTELIEQIQRCNWLRGRIQLAAWAVQLGLHRSIESAAA